MVILGLPITILRNRKGHIQRAEQNKNYKIGIGKEWAVARQAIRILSAHMRVFSTHRALYGQIRVVNQVKYRNTLIMACKASRFLHAKEVN